jgi:hypothetical protein
MPFLDPDKPLATCVAANCGDCSVRKGLHCHFTARDLTRFMVVVSPAFVVGGAGIVHAGAWWLVPWLAIALGYFGLVEIRVMCSHCPHYAEPGRFLQCWANHGSPKLWRYRPGPMSGTEKAVFWAGLVAVVGYPLVFLLVGMHWLLLALFVLCVAAAGTAMKTQMCSQCICFACPLNGVGGDVRQGFFARNPIVAEAWGIEIEGLLDSGR